MARTMGSTAKRPRISFDVTPELRRRIRIAAAKREVSVGQYILELLEERLKNDLKNEVEGMLSLTAAADPVLAALWDNEKDAAYDRL